MKKLFKFFLFLMIFGIVLSCKQEYPGYKKTESGLYYKFYTNLDDIKPQEGQILSIHIQYGTKDSVIFNNRDRGSMPVNIPLEFTHSGDINEGFAMMSKGDSASFIVDATSFYLFTAQSPMPAFINSGSKLYFDVVMVDFVHKEDYLKEQERIAKEILEQSEDLARQEEENLNNYLAIKNIDTKPLESGLIYIEVKKGDGKPVQAGKIVKIHYEGSLLDGTVFDSSKKTGAPIEFIIGSGQVIKGWDEGILLMNLGGKAKLIIPSYLAYGQRGIQNIIPPYSTLVFDVEVVDME